MALVFSLFYTYTQTDIHFRGAAMNFSQARPRVIEGLMKEKVLLKVQRTGLMCHLLLTSIRL